MKKNIVIVVLCVALVTFLFLWLSACANAVKLRAAGRLVRLSGYEVWSRACQHAAEGNAQRAKWCEWAAKETTLTAAQEGITDAEFEALAVEYVLHPKRTPLK